jgi:hypothetical protein
MTTIIGVLVEVNTFHTTFSYLNITQLKQFSLFQLFGIVINGFLAAHPLPFLTVIIRPLKRLLQQ